MEWFHVIVLTVALVMLILLLTFIGLLMTHQKTSLSYPPTYNTCPDYWTITTDGSGCLIPSYKSNLNIGLLYSGPGSLNSSVSTTPGFTSTVDSKSNSVINKINFNDSKWQGSVCNQKKWAANNNIVWDGVSNYNSC